MAWLKKKKLWTADGTSPNQGIFNYTAYFTFQCRFPVPLALFGLSLPGAYCSLSTEGRPLLWRQWTSTPGAGRDPRMSCNDDNETSSTLSKIDIRVGNHLYMYTAHNFRNREYHINLVNRTDSNNLETAFFFIISIIYSGIAYLCLWDVLHKLPIRDTEVFDLLENLIGLAHEIEMVWRVAFTNGLGNQGMHLWLFWK